MNKFLAFIKNILDEANPYNYTRMQKEYMEHLQRHQEEVNAFIKQLNDNAEKRAIPLERRKAI